MNEASLAKILPRYFIVMGPIIKLNLNLIINNSSASKIYFRVMKSKRSVYEDFMDKMDLLWGTK